jgi:hypothetical protein
MMQTSRNGRLWLAAINAFWVFEGKPKGELTLENEREYSEANTIFCGAVVRVLAETIIYVPPLQNR